MSSSESKNSEIKKDVTITSSEKTRQTWNNKTEYLLAMIGNAVGIGNIWRFPYQCQKYGGGAFLIPYFIALAFVGYPLLFMEIALGQKFRQGSVGTWTSVSPYAAGIGICTLIVVCILSSYYIVVVCWSFIYVASSFVVPLPWKQCPLDPNNSTVRVSECESSSPIFYYWYRVTANVPNSVEESTGFINWKILLASAFAMILVFVGQIRGVKSTGKFMYIGVSFPFIILFIMLVRVLTLEGSFTGISTLLEIDETKLLDPTAWQAAITQIFMSIGIGYGVYIAQASYMPTNNNCKFDVLFVATINSSISILATIIVFGTLGFRAVVNEKKCLQKVDLLLNTSVGSIDKNTSCSAKTFLNEELSGPGLAFIAFAEVMLQMPPPNLWSFIFFAMLGSVGVSSVIGTTTGIIASIQDLGFNLKKSHMALVVSIGIFISSIPYAFDFGNYLTEIMDNYLATLTLVPIVIAELIVVNWLFGFRRFFIAVENMTGVSFGLYWKVTLLVITPIILTVSFIGSLYKYASENVGVYTSWNKEMAKEVILSAPSWLIGLVIFLVICCFIFFPLNIALYQLNIFNLPAYLSKKNKNICNHQSNDIHKETDKAVVSLL